MLSDASVDEIDGFSILGSESTTNQQRKPLLPHKGVIKVQRRKRPAAVHRGMKRSKPADASSRWLAPRSGAGRPRSGSAASSSTTSTATKKPRLTKKPRGGGAGRGRGSGGKRGRPRGSRGRGKGRGRGAGSAASSGAVQPQSTSLTTNYIVPKTRHLNPMFTDQTTAAHSNDPQVVASAQQVQLVSRTPATSLAHIGWSPWFCFSAHAGLMRPLRHPVLGQWSCDSRLALRSLRKLHPATAATQARRD